MKIKFNAGELMVDSLIFLAILTIAGLISPVVIIITGFVYLALVIIFLFKS